MCRVLAKDGFMSPLVYECRLLDLWKGAYKLSLSCGLFLRGAELQGYSFRFGTALLKVHAFFGDPSLLLCI